MAQTDAEKRAFHITANNDNSEGFTWVNCLRTLRTTVMLNSSVTKKTKYHSIEHILKVLGKRRNDMLAVHLVKTYCLPTMLYGCEIWPARSVDLRSVDVAWNNAFRKIFNACWRESVKPLQFHCSCLPASLLVFQRRIIFGWKCCVVITWSCILLQAVSDSVSLLYPRNTV